MPDVAFQFNDIPNRYPDVVQRMAVLSPLRGESTTVEAVRGKVYELLEQWRARIGALTQAGWDPGGGKPSHGILYARTASRHLP